MTDLPPNCIPYRRAPVSPSNSWMAAAVIVGMAAGTWALLWLTWPWPGYAALLWLCWCVVGFAGRVIARGMCHRG